METQSTKNLNVAQALMLKTLLRNSWSSELISYCWTRTGATEGEFRELVDLGLVEEAEKRFILTWEGKRELNQLKKRLYF